MLKNFSTPAKAFLLVLICLILVIPIFLIGKIPLEKPRIGSTEGTTSSPNPNPTDVSPTPTPSRTPRPSPTATPTATTTSSPTGVSMSEPIVLCANRAREFDEAVENIESIDRRYYDFDTRHFWKKLGLERDHCVDRHIIQTKSTQISQLPVSVTFDVDRVRARQIWVIMTASNTTVDQNMRRIGKVKAEYQTSFSEFDLTLGMNIADWSFEGDTVKTFYSSPEVRRGWHGYDSNQRRAAQLFALKFDADPDKNLRVISIIDTVQDDLFLDIFAVVVIPADSPSNDNPDSDNSVYTRLCIGDNRGNSRYSYPSIRRFTDIADRFRSDISKTGCDEPIIILELDPFVSFYIDKVLETRPQNTGISEIKIDLDEPMNLSRIHLLLSVRNLCHEQLTETVIGNIKVSFENGHQSELLSLRIGDTVRQGRTNFLRCHRDNLSIRQTTQEHIKIIPGIPVIAVPQAETQDRDAELWLDLYTINVPSESPSDGGVKSIIIEDNSREHDPDDPFITLYAVTLEHEQGNQNDTDDGQGGQNDTDSDS